MQIRNVNPPFIRRTIFCLLCLFCTFWLAALPVFAQTNPINEKANEKTKEEARPAERLRQHAFVSLEGKTVTLDDWQGRIRVVNFWASWCPPCVREIPAFSRLQKKWGGKGTKDTKGTKGKNDGVQFIGIAVEDADKVRLFMRKTPPAYPVWVGNWATLSMTRDLGNRVLALPFTLVLDAEGTPIAHRVGEFAEKDLDAILREASGKTSGKP